jgi:hypothetical protein
MGTVVQVRVNDKWVTVALDPTNAERSYRTFTVLAGVRGRGDLPPIAQPRGLPIDFAVDEGHYHSLPQELHAPGCRPCLRWWMGSHTYSWLTLAEMKTYARPRLVNSAYVSQEGYWRWDKKSEPTSQ